MESSIIAIVIGVSYYAQKDITHLPAAQSDALNFARSIKNWGIPESSIILFLNEDATKKTIEDLFDQFLEKKDNYKFLFYFCGHGHRISTSDIPQSYLLLHDSYVQDNQCLNSLSLDLIINTIGQLNAVESYVLIDACYLRINTIMNPQLEEELKGQKTSYKSLFCLLSSGVEASYESEKGQYGYFTEALLKSFCKIRKSEASPTQLLQHIHQEMESSGLPLPEMYNFGNQEISFLIQPDIANLQKEFIYRHELIAKIQDAWIENRGKWVCLFGETGCGKSTLAKYFESEKLKTIYITIPPSSETDFNPIDYLTDCIKNKLSYHFSQTLSSQELLLKFDELFSFYLIIIDQLERLTPTQLNYLFEGLAHLKTQFLFIFNQSVKEQIHERFQDISIHLEVPTFSYEEGKQFIKMMKPDCLERECQLIYLISQGNPLKMKKVIFFASKTMDLKSAELEKELQKAIAAVYSCGAYINEQLFMKNFHLQEGTLDFLREIGLISYLESRWIPHAFLHEIAETERLPINQQPALNYWYEQIDELPDHIQASRYLILSVKCFGYEEKADGYLKTAIQTLHHKGKENFNYLIDAADIFLPLAQLTETALFLAGILLDWGQFELAHQLLCKQPASEKLNYLAKLLIAQKHWKTGELQKSVVTSSEIIKEVKASAQLIKAYFHRGIAHYLNGNWIDANSDFNFVFQNAQDKHYIGRAQCMLGSISGIRGTDLQFGQKHLEVGSRLLVKIKDFAGVWAGWNNLGEMFWKCGDFKASAFYLEKALELTHRLDQPTARLETLRNLLHLHLRTSGPLSKTVTDLIFDIEQFDWQQYPAFEKIQILNTLSTAYLFRRNTKKALPILKFLIPLTVKNSEYHIYTLSNLALFFKLRGMSEKAETLFNEALQLAQKGENPLAIHQVKNDFLICFKEKPLMKTEIA